LNIVLPLRRPVIVLSLFFSILGSLQAFAIIVALTDGGPSNSTHSAVSYLYNFGIKRMRVGLGSAIGVTLFIICVLVMVFYKRLFMRPKALWQMRTEKEFSENCLRRALASTSISAGRPWALTIFRETGILTTKRLTTSPWSISGSQTISKPSSHLSKMRSNISQN
jgi:hypothetical protein